MTTRNALISVTDKRGLVPLARALAARGVRIIATDGTARFLSSKGVAVRTIRSVTRFPQILGGRVKTLHPGIFAGLLARPEDGGVLKKLNFPRIDFLICNFYDFSGARKLSARELAESIDIGGVALMRAAAKNIESVLPVVSPAQYGEFSRRLASGRMDDADYRMRMAATAWGAVSRYDLEIFSACMSRLNGGAQDSPRWNVQVSEEAMPLRYGENPHQTASYFLPVDSPELPFEVLQGKQLSFCNLLDVHAALALGRDAPRAPFCAILKHTNPCGAAVGRTAVDAFRSALGGDPQSAFGGIVILNRAVDRSTAREITERFFEVIIAPHFDRPARKILECKKSLRLLRARIGARRQSVEVRSALGGMLVQASDDGVAPPSKWKRAAGGKTSRAALADLDLALRLAKHVKSNAVVLVKQGRAIGIGAGQQSRIDSVRIALDKARRYGHTVQGSACASDGFFPFPDSIEHLSRAGVTAIVEPGGSVRDNDVIAAARKSRVSLYLTGRRHFRH